MNNVLRHPILAALTGLVTLLAAVTVSWQWLTAPSLFRIEMRVPGGDGAPARSQVAQQAVDLVGVFQSFDGVPAAYEGSWPRFRGPDFDNIVKDSTPLADHWGASGPPILWSVELGEGYAGPVVWNGRVYLLDYDEEERADAIRCLSLEDGREIWRRSYYVDVKRNHGMSRTVPAVTDEMLVTIGPRCHVVCLDPLTGDFRWGIDMQRDYGAEEPLWYTGQCPLIDGSWVILAPGGPDVLMMAVDGLTGEPVWTTPNTPGWKMSHSSIIPMTIAGRYMYVYSAVGGVVGVAADGPDTGALLWQLPWNARVIAPSPVPLGDGRIFIGAGYGEGGMMIRVREDGGVFAAEILYRHGPKDGLAAEQHTPIYYDGLLYSIMPKDAGALRSQFVCYDPDGSLVWSSGQAQRFGLGPFLFADGKCYILNDTGELTMLRISRAAYEELDRAQVLHGQDAWGPIALVGDRMLVRDLNQMACISVGAAS